MERHPLAQARRNVSSANEHTLKVLPANMLHRLKERVKALLAMDKPIPTEADHFLRAVLENEVFGAPNIERRFLQLAGSATYRALCSDDQRVVQQLRERGLDPSLSRYLLHARLYTAGKLAGRAEERARAALAAMPKPKAQSSTEGAALSSHRTVHSSPAEGDRGAFSSAPNR